MSRCENLARLSVFIVLLALPFSRFIVNQVLILGVIFVLLSGNYRAKWEFIKQYRFPIISLVLLGLFLIGIFYGNVPIKEGFKGFAKYSKLLFVFFFLPLFHNAKHRRIALNCLLFSVGLSLFISTLDYHGIFNLTSYLTSGLIFPQSMRHAYFMNPTAVSVLISLSCFILLNRTAKKEKYSFLYFILFSFFTYQLFFINVQRVGILIYFALLGLFIIQYLGIKKGSIVLLFALPIIVGTAYLGSTHVYGRVQAAKSDMKLYAEGKSETSLGYRIAFMQYSLPIIKEHLIFGAGSGSFGTLYMKTGGPLLTPGVPVGEPHNEYLHILFQIGILGFAVFLWWIFSQWQEAYQLPAEEKWLVHAMIISYLIAAATSVPLLWNTTGILYMMILSICFGARHEHRTAV